MSQKAMQTERADQKEDVMVEVDNLRTYYDTGGLFGSNPVKAVDGVSFDIRRGETLGLVGESGCGKTTLGRTLIQLEKATGGEIRFEGTDITTLSGADLKAWRRDAQIVFQDPDSSLNDRMTVGEIVREPLDVFDWKTPRDRRQRVRKLLEKVGLQREHYFRYPHQFSGGQRQRIGIARTLTLEPEFIVLDEPVSALDVSVQAEVINLLEDLQDEFGLTYLFIAHDLSVVRHICDRVAVMYLGNIMEIGPTEELFTDPSNPYTHALLSAIPKPDPTAKKDRITLHGTPPNPRHPPDGCPFSTRCPARIRPPEFDHLGDELWTQLGTLREILRERKRTERKMSDRVRELLGKDPRLGTVDEIYDELFSDISVPEDVERILSNVANYVRDNDEESALEIMNESFGSVCDQDMPQYYTVSESGRKSFCHRHDDAYEEPGPVLDERHR
ncbi:ABC transporter ATP-binding protein [Natronosalvus halobius]|uniref:ABC transporter ATP-binding protein n=1 Tax=Natronosalvus halobius TaxID=2953746 RepID=UPI00209EBA6E|nr:oligopeptide/dipeptide ABC transporter ATP-binding protein [Natronosalvus halobius]USZ72771.1 ATP-binding cassette domain-containing protein [Natronosalvus halobius]